MSPPEPRLDDLRIERGNEASRPKRNATWAILAVALAIAGTATWWFTRAQTLPVTTATARTATGSAEHTVLNASGYVTARRAATVSSKVTAKVVDVLIEEGFSVKEAQVLAHLDATNVQASLQLAIAQQAAATSALEETRVRLVEAEQELTRQSALQRSNVAARADFDHADAAAKALRARLVQQQNEVTVADRTIAIWRQQLDDTIIRAPFGGIVTSKNAQPGEMISPISAGGGFTRTGICTIVDMTSLEIEIDVNEAYLHRVAAGQPVEATLDAYPDWKIPCKVIAIIPTADRQKATVKVRVGFEQLDARILPDMAVKVAFRESRPAASPAATATRTILVPKAAVRSEDGRDIVFVVNHGRAERRAVTILSQQANDVALSAGVTAGERLIMDAAPGLADGVAVVERKP